MFQDFYINFRAIFGLALAALVASCSSQSPEGVKNGKLGGTSLPARGALNSPSEIDKDDNSGEPGELAVPDLSGALKASFKVTVRLDGSGGFLGLANLIHLEACNGPLDLAVNPSAEALKTGDISKLLVIGASQPINCPAIQSSIDISKLLGGFFAAKPTGEGLPIKKVGDVLALTSLLGVSYEPARPLFPSLLAGKKENLAQLSTSSATTATFDGRSYQGTFGLEMKEYDTPYQPPGMSFTFPKSMYFSTTASGFEGLDPLKGLIFDQLNFRLSIAPIAITQIEVKGRADKLISIITSVPDEALSGLLKTIAPIVKNTVNSKGIDNQILMGLSKDITATITISLTNQEGLGQVSQDGGRGETFSAAAAGPQATN